MGVIMKIRILLALLLLMPGVSFAGVNFYMKIPDIPGESKNADHEGEIDVYGISWSMSQSGRLSCLEDMEVNKLVDLSTPYLFLAQSTGRAFDEVVIMARKDSGDAHLDYLTITLSNVMISSLSTGGDRGDNPLTEKVTLGFDKMTIKYVVQNEDGSGGDEHITEIYPGSKCK